MNKIPIFKGLLNKFSIDREWLPFSGDEIKDIEIHPPDILHFQDNQVYIYKLKYISFIFFNIKQKS